MENSLDILHLVYVIIGAILGYFGRLAINKAKRK